MAREESGNLVALKVYNRSFQSLLESEVKSLARLNDSHMVRILNHGQDGRLFGCKKSKKRPVLKKSKAIKKRVIRLNLKSGSSTVSTASNLSQN